MFFVRWHAPSPPTAVSGQSLILVPCILTQFHTALCDHWVVGCVPLRSKGQLELMTREVLSFTAGLGHAEVIFRCDNEPTMRQLLKYIVSRTRLNGIKQSVPGVTIPSAQDSRGSLRSMLRESALWSLAMRSSTPWIPIRTAKI